MNPWTGLLQALHSALIDELTERVPEPKPELGLPIRLSGFGFPDPALAEALACRVTLGGAQGMGLLAMDAAACKALGLGPEELWKAAMKRAGSEMLRRGIMPRLEATLTLKNGMALSPALPQPGRTVWIPFKLSDASVFLGMAV